MAGPRGAHARARDPQFTVDGHRPVGDFDVFGLSFSTELGYTNLLVALDLAGIPLQSRDRTDEHPIVVAGGHAAFNPEPIAEFIDAAVLGDGEQAVLGITEVIRAARRPRRLGPRADPARARRAAASPTCRASTTSNTCRRPDPPRRAEPRRTCRAASGQAHRHGPRRVAVSEEAAGAARRDASTSG